MKNVYLVIVFFVVSLFEITASDSIQLFSQKLPPTAIFDNEKFLSPRILNLPFETTAEKLIKEDEEAIKAGFPFRIAVSMPSDLNIHKEEYANWLSLPSGQNIWKQSLKAEGAKGLVLTFKELYLPPGSELYLYTPNKEIVEIYTNETNPSGGYYVSDTFYDNEVILEYLPALSSAKDVRIELANVGYVYRSKAELQNDLFCFINVNCPEAADWQKQKKGVVCLYIQKGFDQGYCTGSLINNIRQDKTPYVLTADHCFTNANENTFASLRVEFFKEDKGSYCLSDINQSFATKTIYGAELIATNPFNGGSDGSLLKLSKRPDPSWDVYYNGWNVLDEAAENGVCIHHPRGIVKKISTYKDATRTIKNASIEDMLSGDNAMWGVNWSSTENGTSVTTGGSSGSPLFNQDGHIIGSLSGGSSSCRATYNTDYFGKIAYHWDKYDGENQQLKTFLDPDNTGLLVVDGLDPKEEQSKPMALSATNITASGFTTNWDLVSDADCYLLDIYTRDELSSTNNYLEAYRSKKIENANSFLITNLQPSTTYYYSLRSVVGTSISGYSNEIRVETEIVNSLKEINNFDVKIFLHPNTIEIKTNTSLTFPVYLYSIGGQIIKQTVIEYGKAEIAKEQIGAGIYILKIGNRSYKLAY